jgi:2'-5' RNA ligase
MLLNTGSNLRLVKPENIHITIRFLGNITLPLVDQISEQMNKISINPFEVEIQGLGAFPSLKHIKVIWAGIQKGSNELMNIFNQLEPHLQKLGLKPDRRGFNPHLTIARVRTARFKGKLTHLIRDLTKYEFGKIKTNHLKLKKSVLTPKGPIYNTIYEVNLVKG